MARAPHLHNFSLAVLAIYLPRVKNTCCPCYCITPGIAAEMEAQAAKHYFTYFAKFPANAPVRGAERKNVALEEMEVTNVLIS